MDRARDVGWNFWNFKMWCFATVDIKHHRCCHCQSPPGRLQAFISISGARFQVHRTCELHTAFYLIICDCDLISFHTYIESYIECPLCSVYCKLPFSDCPRASLPYYCDMRTPLGPCQKTTFVQESHVASLSQRPKRWSTRMTGSAKNRPCPILNAILKGQLMDCHAREQPWLMPRLDILRASLQNWESANEESLTFLHRAAIPHFHLQMGRPSVLRSGQPREGNEAVLRRANTVPQVQAKIC